MQIKDAGFSHAEISKTPTGTRVALHVTRPGNSYRKKRFRD